MLKFTSNFFERNEFLAFCVNIFLINLISYYIHIVVMGEHYHIFYTFMVQNLSTWISWIDYTQNFRVNSLVFAIIVRFLQTFSCDGPPFRLIQIIMTFLTTYCCNQSRIKWILRNRNHNPVSRMRN